MAVALTEYPTWADPSYAGLFDVQEWYYDASTWAAYKAEIDAGRPVVLLVDTDGDGGTDHFVTGIGYSENPNQYAIHDTWDNGVHWFAWRGLATGNRWGIYGVHFFIPRVGFSGTPRVGDVPVTVQFTGTSVVPVDSWGWTFGDGDSSSVQSPVHTYDSPGVFDVAMHVVSSQLDLRFVRNEYVIALADTMRSPDKIVDAYAPCEVVIGGRNHVPLWRIEIPISYSGSLDLTLDSFSTAGCRTGYFPGQSWVSFDPANHRAAVVLSIPPGLPIADLPAGEGPLVKLYFTTGSCEPGQTVDIDLGGYSTYAPSFTGDLLDYTPKVRSPRLTYGSCCQGIRGDVNMDGKVLVSDITRLVGYLFGGGEELPCEDEADVNGDGMAVVSDLTYLVAYLFRGGPPPLNCVL